MSENFVWPGNGIGENIPVWGHSDGLRVGLAPTRGPRGLLRIYAPYLDQEFPRVVNFVSVEPTVKGNSARSQSELATSSDKAGAEGLGFYPSNSLGRYRKDGKPPPGVITDDGDSCAIFVHTETFPDGAEPVIRVRFHREQPYEVELSTFASATSSPMESCVLSATMGNFALLRHMRVADGSVSAHELWDADDPLDDLDFLPWRTIESRRLHRDEGGRPIVTAFTDTDAEGLVYDENVAEHWRYVGKRASHAWMVEADANPVVAVNARRTYWRSQAAIPGGATIENFELRTDFVDGQKFWFRVDPA
jgi:hypothetical protein